jgi:hypothetical protein
MQRKAAMNPTLAFFEQLAPMLAVLALVVGALWVGTLFAASWLCGRSRFAADPTELGTLAVALNRRWTTPFLFVSVTSAAAWLCLLPNGALSTRWLYVVCVAILSLVFIHTSVRRRATRIASGSVSAIRGEALMRVALVVSVAVVVALGSVRAMAAP